MEFTDEKRNQLLEMYLKKLGETGVETSLLKEKYGELLKNGTYSNNIETGLAFDGSLLYAVLYKLTIYALKINEIFPEGVRADRTTLIKVCLLCQIGKCLMFTLNDNKWEIEKRGLLYKFVDDGLSIRVGMRSVAIANECGITLTPQEIEMMTINDREATELDARYHASIPAYVLRMASETVFLIHRKK